MQFGLCATSMNGLMFLNKLRQCPTICCCRQRSLNAGAGSKQAAKETVTVTILPIQRPHARKLIPIIHTHTHTPAMFLLLSMPCACTLTLITHTCIKCLSLNTCAGIPITCIHRGNPCTLPLITHTYIRCSITSRIPTVHTHRGHTSAHAPIA